VFCVESVRVTGAKALGKDGRHLRLKLQAKNGQYYQAIGFGLAESEGGVRLTDQGANYASLAFVVVNCFSKDVKVPIDSFSI